MCGLFGVIGQGISKEDLAIFQDLMIFNAVRGTDSTGVATGRSATFKVRGTDTTVKVIKKACDPIWFLQNLEKDEEKNMNDTFHDFYLGHDRWKTTGEVTKEAAQPFEYSNVVGTHNGTFSSLKLEGFQSDSDAFFNRVNELGIRATVMTLKPQQDGYALVWYDKVERKIKFLRNGKKNFWFTYHPTRNVLYYSSELGMLRAALDRRGIDYTDVFYPQIDTLYTIDPQNLKKNQKPLLTSSLCTPLNIVGVPNTGAPFDGGKKMEGPNYDC